MGCWPPRQRSLRAIHGLRSLCFREIDVTLAAAPSQQGIAANPALAAALAITLIAATTLAGAWFFELVLEIRPCPLCLEQRYAYYLAVALGMLTAYAASRHMARQVLMAAFAVLLAACLANAWLGGY